MELFGFLQDVLEHYLCFPESKNKEAITISRILLYLIGLFRWYTAVFLSAKWLHMTLLMF